MSNKLKSCPFCGTEPVYETDGGYEATIRCPQCRQAQVKASWYGGDLGLTEACWNKRINYSNSKKLKTTINTGRKLKCTMS